MSVSRPLTESQVAELRRQLEILESKAAQATEPVVREALVKKIEEIKRSLGEAPEPVSPTKTYHVYIGGAAQGPMDATAVEALIRARQIDASAKAWTQGMANWGDLSTFTEFAEVLANPSVLPSAKDTPLPASQLREEPPSAEAITEQPRSAAETAAAKKKRWEDDIVLPPAASPDQIRQADEFLRQAKIAKMRGSTQEYARLLGQAQAVAPGAPSVLEAMGDDLMERGNVGEARVSYYKAHRMAPKNVQIERKYAEVVFQASANKSWETQMMLETEAVANARYAAVLSAIVPGVGQLVLQERVKGIVMIVIWFISLVGIIVFRNDVQALIRMVAGLHTKPSITVLFVMGVFAINWVASIYDCVAKTKGKGETAGLMAFINQESGAPRKDKKERPVPPANLPFE